MKNNKKKAVHLQQKSWRRNETAKKITYELGQRIRELRNREGWSREEISQRSGISKSSLYRIETNKMSPTFDVLFRIIDAIGCDLSEVFLHVSKSEQSRRVAVSRAENGEAVKLPGISYELLCSNSMLEVIKTKLVTIEYGNERPQPELHGHPGEEFCYLLKGELQVILEDREPVVLKKGDSIKFDSSIPHDYIAQSEENAVLLMVNYGERQDGESEDLEIADKDFLFANRALN